jgi:hypothetical protein
MDKAYWNHMRWGHFRWDVTDPKFDQILEGLKNQPARHGAGIAPCVEGEAREGMTRESVTVPVFDEILERMKQSG